MFHEEENLQRSSGGAVSRQGGQVVTSYHKLSLLSPMIKVFHGNLFSLHDVEKCRQLYNYNYDDPHIQAVRSTITSDVLPCPPTLTAP